MASIWTRPVMARRNGVQLGCHMLRTLDIPGMKWTFDILVHNVLLISFDAFLLLPHLLITAIPLMPCVCVGYAVLCLAHGLLLVGLRQGLSQMDS